jgi:moderate conductance mechanosensitive channel
MNFSPATQAWLLGFLRDVVWPIILIVVISLVLIALARRAVHGVVRRALDREVAEGTAQELSAVEVKKRIDTLDGLLTAVIRTFIFLVALVMVLGELNLNIGPAVAGLGIVGIAVGFGSQSLVRDYFNGALILLENQYSKGDVVTIADVSGTVEDFSLRRTTLRDLDGVVHTVPNGQITVASNRTRTWARINQDVTVAYGTDIEVVTQVINDVGKAMAADPAWRRRVLEAPHVERVEALAEYGITLKILGLVRAPEKWAAGGELRKRLLAAFATHGIEIPHPQRVVLTHAVDQLPPAGGPSDDDLSAGME